MPLTRHSGTGCALLASLTGTLFINVINLFSIWPIPGIHVRNLIRKKGLKALTGLTLVAGLVLAGCSSQSANYKTLYLKTAMQSPVSGLAGYSDPAADMLRESHIRHVRLYTLKPQAGKTFQDNLERKLTAAKMYIDLVEDKTGYNAEISGEINYYDTQHYVNGVLTGDVIKSVPVPLRKISLSVGKPVSLELPRGIRFSAQLSGDAFSGTTY